jgi:uncharacterized membrane protein YkvA (DUF1232 family)
MDLGLVIGVGLSIVALWALVLVILWLSRPKGVPVREMVGVVPDVLRLLRSLITDGSVPLDVRIVLVGLLLWIVSPIDLIPEFIPVLGPLDDVLVAVVAMRYVRHRLGVDELLRRWSGSVNGFAVLTRVIGSS